MKRNSKIFGSEFYNASTRKYIVVMGTLFNEIKISRDDNSSVQQKRMTVPISYGPAQKFLQRIRQDPDVNTPQAIQLPRLSFQLEQINYDPQRRLGENKRNHAISAVDDSAYTSQFTPAPYDLEFTVTIYAKYQEDGLKILEQILPYFKPKWTTSVQLIDELPEKLFDIPVVLNSVSNDLIYEGSFDERAIHMWTLSFTMKGYFFGPVTSRKVIKFANVTTYAQMVSNGSITSNTAGRRVLVYPGVTSANTPADFISSQVVQATATASVANGEVDSVTVTNKGLGYSNGTVTFSDPDVGANTATGSLVIVGDKVQSIELVNPGSGYSNTPTLTISSPDDVSVAYANVNSSDNWDYITIIEDVNYE